MWGGGLPHPFGGIASTNSDCRGSFYFLISVLLVPCAARFSFLDRVLLRWQTLDYERGNVLFFTRTLFLSLCDYTVLASDKYNI